MCLLIWGRSAHTYLAAGFLSGGGVVALVPVDDVNVGEELASGGAGVAPVAASGQVETQVGAFPRSGFSGGGEIVLVKGSKGGFSSPSGFHKSLKTTMLFQCKFENKRTN